MSRTEYLDGKVILHGGDCRDAIRSLADASIDSVVTDPPYALVSIVKRFGKPGAAPAKGGVYARSGAGFMGKQWDTGDAAFAIEFWLQVLRVLKPGGHVLAFSGTRTYHRLAVAIEDAGFEIRDQIGWAYGSGFPKSHDVSKGIDKRAGAEREVVGTVRAGIARSARKGGEIVGALAFEELKHSPVTVPATDEAREWEGWGTALKPAWEPIVLARKPLAGTVVDTVLQHGTGALNIDGCRVSFANEDDRWKPEHHRQGSMAHPMDWQTDGDRFLSKQPSGRWPANIIHDGSAEVVAAFPDAPGQQRHSSDADRTQANVYGATSQNGKEYAPRNDEGSAARFFYTVEKEERCGLCRVLLGAKYAKDSPCAANIATPTSPTRNTLSDASVHADAAGLPPLESEAMSQPSSGLAHNAGSHSSGCRQPISSIAPSDALISEVSRIGRNVKSAANLCDLCATDIAQRLAAMRLGLDPASLPCLESMPERRRQILLQNLALYVAGRENTDTITTTASLKTFFGSVFHAIASITSSERSESAANTEAAPARLFYSSKADADDRLGSKHPTVKPLDLMQYLVRLVTPLGGTVLDPFAGTGTTGEAAWREGMRAVLIEREEEYQADIARRMDLAQNPTKRAAVAKSKNNLQGAEGTPLFSEDAA